MNQRLRILISIILILTWLYIFPNSKRKILVIHSYHHGLHWSDQITKGINSVFQPYRHFVEIHYDYLDTKKYASEDYNEVINKLFEIKYKNNIYDVIVVADNNALNYIQKTQKSIFYNAPVVFCGINSLTKESIKGLVNYTGITEYNDFAGNINAILKIHPDTKNIVVLIDKTTTGKIIYQAMKQEIKSLSKNLNINFHNDFTFLNLKNYLSSLSEGTIIYLSLLNRDNNDEYMSFQEIAEYVSYHSKVPVYGSTDSYTGNGIVGGKITSGFYQGKHAALKALKILNNVSPSNIPIQYDPPNKFIFDYNELKRFNISTSRLPKDHVIINKPKPFYIKYRYLINYIVAIISMIMFLLLIFILFQKKKYNQLSKKKNTLDKRIRLKTLEKYSISKEYEAIFNNCYTGILHIATNQIKAMNFKGYEIFEIHKQELNKHIDFFISLQDALLNTLFYSKHTTELEIITPKTRNRKWCSFKINQIDKNNKKAGYIWVFEDISSKKSIDNVKDEMKNILHQDMRSPINNILNCKRKINNFEELSDKAKLNLNQIGVEASKILSAIDTSIDIIKLEKNEYKCNFDEVDVIDLVHIATQDHLSICENKSINILITLNNKAIRQTDKFLINADKLLSYSMFSNIIKNKINTSKENSTITINFDNIYRKVLFNNNLIIDEDSRKNYFDKNQKLIPKLTSTEMYSASLMAKAMNIDMKIVTSKKDGTTLILVFN